MFSILFFGMEGRMAQRLSRILAVLCLALLHLACSRPADRAAAPPPTAPASTAKPALPPPPAVNHAQADAAAGEKIDHGELIVSPDDARKKLHAQHHSHNVLEVRRVPGKYTAPAMAEVKDFYLQKKDLDVINPGPWRVRERHGGPAPRLPEPDDRHHLHRAGRRSADAHAPGRGVARADVGTEGDVRASATSSSSPTGPYIINIPPMTPHSFQNLDDRVAELVVIFPTNVWEYDVLDYFPFSSERAKQLAAEAKAGTAGAKTEVD
jgi:hypothetical protein